MNDAWTGISFLLIGSLFFPLVYNFSTYLLKHGCKDKLSNGDIYQISEKITCSLQAIMSFMVGVSIVSQVSDIMVDVHWLTNSYACFALPYFLNDIRAMYNTFIWNSDDSIRQLSSREQLKRFVQSSPLLLAHHSILPAVIFPIIIFLRRNLGDFFVGTFYMIEVTIPFISARAILAQLSMKNTPYYILVGVCMLVSFFCARVLVFPYLYWRYALYAGISFVEVPLAIPIKCSVGCLMILLPQLYWFYLMFRGSTKVFYKIYVHWKSKHQ